MIPVIVRSPDKQKKLEAFIERIHDAKDRGAEAEADVYVACRELELSRVWNITGWSFDQLLREIGVNPGGYTAFSLAVQLLGQEQTIAVGIHAAREMLRVIRLSPLPDKEMKKQLMTLYKSALERIESFKLIRHHAPSPQYQRQIVLDQARSLGMEVPEKRPDLRDQLSKAIAALEQIADIATPGSAAAVIAGHALKVIGIRDTVETVEDEVA